MNLWALIPLISCLTFTALFILVLLQAKRRVDRVFALFLFASGVWSFTSFMLIFNPSASSQHLIFWNELVIAAIPWLVVSYYHFVKAYNNKPGGIGLYLGYAFVLTILALCLGGYVVKSATLVDGFLYHDIKPWDYVIAGILVPILALAMWRLVQRYRSSTDSTDRNRTAYLMTGWSILLVISYITPFTPALAGLPTDHLGNLANALIITYAILRYQLLDIKLVVRKGLAYSWLTVCLTAIYLLLLLTLQMFFQHWVGYSSLALAAGFALLLAVLFTPLRNITQEWVDRLFYRDTYDYRQMLLTFSTRMSNVLDLGELAQSMLYPIVKAMHTTKAALLFPDAESGDFRTHFVQPIAKEEATTKLRCRQDSPIIAWLAREGKALKRGFPDLIPELKGLWEVERDELKALEVELLCPIMSKGKLIGILALSKKQSDVPYSDEEINLLMTMATGAAIAIENARLFDESQRKVKELAVISELNRVITYGLDIKDVFQALAAGLKKLVDFDCLSMGLVEGNKVRFRAVTSETSPELQSGKTYPLKDSATGWVRDNKRVNIERDFTRERQFPIDELHLRDGFRSAIRLPLLSKGEVFGTINLTSHRPNAYGPEEQEIMERLVPQLAMALESAAMLKDLKKQQLRVERLLAQTVTAREEERRRVSIELHDSIAQWLVGALYHVQSCNTLLQERGGDKIKGELAAIESTLDRSVKELRRVMVGLHPPALDELGLAHALRQALEDLKTDGIAYYLETTGAPMRLPPSVEIAIYRIVGEALTNLRRHAEATAVNLRVQFRANELLIEVRDNGKGFDLPQTLDLGLSTGHIGLLGMKQRAEMLGGTLQIETDKEAGTSIVLALPIQP